jgi:hypothetical protein
MSFSKRKYIKAGMVLVAIVLVIVAITLFSGYFTLKDVSKYGIAFVFLLGFLYYPLCLKLIDWIEKTFLDPVVDEKKREMKNSRKGFEGENIVNVWLEEIVGKENFFKNISFQCCNFDIDNVIVCDKGVIAIEVKNLSDSIHFDDENCYYEKEDGKRYIWSYEDPRSEVKRHSNALRNYLNEHGFDTVKMNRILVFPNGKVSWEGDLGIFIAKDKESLRRYIASSEADNVCTAEVQAEIKKLLNKL